MATYITFTSLNHRNVTIICDTPEEQAKVLSHLTLPAKVHDRKPLGTFHIKCKAAWWLSKV